MNRGKDFEATFRKQLETEFDVTRLADNTAGYMGNRNISDFIVYKYPFQYYLELKTTKGNTLPFSNITDNQYLGLIEKEKVEGVGAGLVVWYLEHDLTYFVSAGLMQKMKEAGKKSINIKELKELSSMFEDNQYFDCFEITGNKKRVFFDYDIKLLAQNLEVYSNYGNRSKIIA